MKTKELEIDIETTKQKIEQDESALVIAKKGLARIKTMFADAIAAESETSELENGDYGKKLANWVFIGGKVLWDDGIESQFPNAHFIDSRRGNFIREMEDATDGKDD